MKIGKTLARKKIVVEKKEFSSDVCFLSEVAGVKRIFKSGFLSEGKKEKRREFEKLFFPILLFLCIDPMFGTFISKILAVLQN